MHREDEKNGEDAKNIINIALQGEGSEKVEKVNPVKKK